MKKLVAGSLLAALVTFAGIAFADGGTLQDRELQTLFASSAQAPQSAGPVAQSTHPADGGSLLDRDVRTLFEWSAQAVESAKQNVLTAGPGAKVTSIPAYIEYQGLDSN